MALPLRRVHLSKEVPPDCSCPLSSQGCPGAADASFISTFYRQVRRSSHAHSAASLAPVPHMPLSIYLLGAFLSCRWVSCFSPASRSWYLSWPLRRLRHTGRPCNVARAVTRCRYSCAVRCAFACSVAVLRMSAARMRRAFPIRCAPSMRASENLVGRHAHPHLPPTFRVRPSTETCTPEGSA